MLRETCQTEHCPDDVHDLSGGDQQSLHNQRTMQTVLRSQLITCWYSKTSLVIGCLKFGSSFFREIKPYILIEFQDPPIKLTLTHNEAEILCISSLKKRKEKNVVVAIVVIKQARKQVDLKQSL